MIVAILLELLSIATMPAMSKFGIKEITERSCELIENPDQTDAVCFRQGGLVRDPDDKEMWVASGYELVDKILKDKRFGKQAPVGTADRLPKKLRLRNERQKTKQLNFLDPPEHTRVRCLLLKAFDTIRVEQRRDAIQTIIDRILDQLIPIGSMDIMRDFAYPISSILICDMLGIPEGKRARLQGLSNILIDGYSLALSAGDGKEDLVVRRLVGLVDVASHQLVSHLAHEYVDVQAGEVLFHIPGMGPRDYIPWWWVNHIILGASPQPLSTSPSIPDFAPVWLSGIATPW